MAQITYNRPFISEEALGRIREAVENLHLSGNGPFTQQCQALLERQLGAARVLITHSCTGALEMAAILADINRGDEVIMPSYTFVSTANAVVLRGGVPVFVDIREDTLNIDERLIAEAITSATKAISVVHYAGVACEMDAILAVAAAHGLAVIEDAAQAINARYRGRPLGSIGDYGAISFHETKNVISGEGGALVVRDPAQSLRAEIIWEKGTNRVQFARGEIDKYTWVDIGSSFLPSDIVAAILLTQLEQSDAITSRRLKTWQRYHDAFASLESAGLFRRPIVPEYAEHNGHLYYLIVPDRTARDRLLTHLRARGVMAVFHYVPLHSAPAGRRYGRTNGTLRVTEDLSARLVRLPMHLDMSTADQDFVINAVRDFFAAR
jgi:dTDP-4-amino-4,6-dideoxygalactose transaminase